MRQLAFVTMPDAQKLCLNPTCQRPARARGYCTTHYGRLRRHKDPNGSGGQVRGVVQVTGIRVRPEVANALEIEAGARDTSMYLLVRDVLEAWYKGWCLAKGQKYVGTSPEVDNR